MPEIMDKMEFVCPHCNAKISFSINIIRLNPVLKCPKCKKELKIKTDLDKRLKAMEGRIEKMLKETTIKFKL